MLTPCYLGYGPERTMQYNTSQREASLAVALCVLVFTNGIEDTVSKLLSAMDLPVIKPQRVKGTGDD